MRKHRLKINGKSVTPEEFHRGGKIGGEGIPMFAGTAYSTAKPLVSEALGCMKSQVPDMRRLIETEGIKGIQITDSGQAEITSRRGRNHLMRVLSEIRGNQYHDIDGGYGDG